jgi:tetratricopeptide (TPR) repeat protein
MKAELGERQNIAWFKLAEFVTRGEKERALSLFRLLTHSFADQAFIKKLEAEILASFDDEQAFSEYIQAAHLYRTKGQSVEAVSIYETLVIFQPDRPEYCEKIISLFNELGHQEKTTQYQKQLCSLFLTQERVDKAIAVFEKMNGLDDVEKLSFFQVIVLKAIQNRYPQQAVITAYLHKALEGLLRFAGDTELNRFLTSLEALNALWYKDAVAYLKEF